MILVMPFGSTGSFTDKEWANGTGPDEGWETFLSRDLVRASTRAIGRSARGAARALGGLSEGGYGALNIGLHHPGEFRVLESWSGYEHADRRPLDLRPRRALLAWNSPRSRLPGRPRATRGTTRTSGSTRAPATAPRTERRLRGRARAGAAPASLLHSPRRAQLGALARQAAPRCSPRRGTSAVQSRLRRHPRRRAARAWPW